MLANSSDSKGAASKFESALVDRRPPRRNILEQRARPLAPHGTLTPARPRARASASSSRSSPGSSPRIRIAKVVGKDSLDLVESVHLVQALPQFGGTRQPSSRTSQGACGTRVPAPTGSTSYSCTMRACWSAVSKRTATGGAGGQRLPREQRARSGRKSMAGQNDPRAIITPAHPVSRCMRYASSAVLMSPLPMTGMSSASRSKLLRSLPSARFPSTSVSVCAGATRSP